MSTELGERQSAEGNWRLRNWRVRARLVALILVPTAAAVLLGGIQVFTSTGAASDYAATNRLARLSAQVGELTHLLSAERARTSWFIARKRPESLLGTVRSQMSAVDQSVSEVRATAHQVAGEVTGRTADQIENMLSRLDDLAGLRQQALEANLLPGAAVELYTTVIDNLLSIHGELIKGSTDDELFRQSRMLDGLARAKESLSLQQALVTVALAEGAFDQAQLRTFLGELSRETAERRDFAAEATAGERRFFDETVNGQSADRMLFLRELVLIRATRGLPLRGLDLSARDDAKEWFDAATVVVDAMRQVERRQADGIVGHSETLSSGERGQALVTAGAVLALLVAVLLITTGVARSLVRPLRRLRGEALEIAGRRLPEFVQQLRESRDGATTPDVPPIGVFTRDEVGEVARAFDEVHREAVRLAGDEARLRANVNAMFVNLSRRSQTLVERQLTLIERLERGERDDTRLGDLFKLDHLATRMRRNSENLLVLAGQEAARKWSEPVELMDVVRAAVGEVESYDRVSAQAHSEVAIAGQAVTDVVHLLAELVENAVSFSPGDTKVVISSSRIDGGGLMVSVTDNGIGMSQEELAQANDRLANPPVVDVSASRRMGLFVVGRLALRHRIRVLLRRGDVGGLTAMVLLPEVLLAPAPAAPGMPGMAGTSGMGGMPGMAEAGRPRHAVAAPLAAPTHDPTHDPTPGTLQPGGLPAGGLQGGGLHPGGPQPGGLTGGAAYGTPSTPGPGHPSYDLPTPEPSSWFSSPHTYSGETSMPDLPPAAPSGPARPGPQEPSHLPADDFPPGFSEVETGWFTKPAATQDHRDPGWSSPADQGWRAAGAAEQPVMDGTTGSGLPKRTPKANLVPGVAATPPPPPPAPPPSPDRLRSRLASYQQGVRKGRAELEED
uniref:nitrate- and nitrite sensing domain-containing protein n=1 Tax=Nonomuraea pusilla TaxID=46177 RepID=UPI0006E2C0C2|nr:nitrate- and nitrite sensing domain-containing protein [Nonomuraea pusilla]